MRHAFWLLYLVDQAAPTPISSVIAALAFLNTLGIFGLVYQAGQFIGDNRRRWKDADEKLAKLEAGQTLIHSQEIIQAKTEAAITAMQKALEESRTEMRAEMKTLRRRSHELSNIMTRLVLEGKSDLKPLVGGDDEQESG